MQVLTFKFRIKDATARKHLARMAIASNRVWNFCVATQREAQRRRAGGFAGRWLSFFDLCHLAAGSSAMLGVHSDTVAMVCKQFVTSRERHGRNPDFRSSFGSGRSLGWVPFRQISLRLEPDHVVYLKRKYRFWKSREIEGKLKSGCFVEDARGRWYICFQCEVEDKKPTGAGQIGIDLGLKSLATCSDGTTIPALQHYRQYQAALSNARRSKNMRRVRAIHAKIANSRRHHLHEWSTKLARENELIVVGNVSPSQLARTRMAKSILDASWTMLRTQLRYKASRHGAQYVEADERWTSATCSDCGAVSGPRGIAGLRVRHWECPECGHAHDRDVNAARNILRVGAERRPPVVGIPSRDGANERGRSGTKQKESP